MFTLHPVLEKDGILLGRCPLCLVLLMNDANYPWLILVPQREGVREIYQLSTADRHQLMHESSYVSQRLAEIFSADKMNVAALGNVVPQLHIHHVVRYRHDSAWPAPIWGRLPAKPYEESLLAEISVLLHEGLAKELTPI